MKKKIYFSFGVEVFYSITNDNIKILDSKIKLNIFLEHKVKMFLKVSVGCKNNLFWSCIYILEPD